MVDLNTQRALEKQFTDDYAWSGELDFHDSRTVSVHKLGQQHGSVHIRPETQSLGWTFKKVDGYFRLKGSIVRTLDGAPSHIGSDLDIVSCENLTSLGSTLDYVGGELYIVGSKLTSLVGGPKTVGKDVKLNMPALESLEGFPRVVGGAVHLNYTPTIGLLRTLVSSKIGVYSTLWPDESQEVENILNKYAGQGRRGMFPCKKELIEAGFEENARW